MFLIHAPIFTLAEEGINVDTNALIHILCDVARGAIPVSYHVSPSPVPKWAWPSLIGTIMSSIPLQCEAHLLAPTCTSDPRISIVLAYVAPRCILLGCSRYDSIAVFLVNGARRCSTLSGYFVTAPNLVGHGSRVSTDYHSAPLRKISVHISKHGTIPWSSVIP